MAPFNAALFVILLAAQSLLAGCDTTLTGIDLAAGKPLPKGTSAQLVATGRYSDGTQQDVTSLLTWTSDNPAAVTVSDAVGSKGLVTAVGRGSARITGRYGDRSAVTSIRVGDALIVAIAITPAAPHIASGTTIQLTATATLSDGTTQDVTTMATWSSQSAQVAAVVSGGGRSGLLTGLTPGKAVIRATAAELTGSVVLGVTDATLVSLAVSPVNPTLASGSKQQLIAIGTFSDSSTQDLSGAVSWSSSDGSVAMVTDAPASRGLCSALTRGVATLTAAFAGQSGSTLVTVTDATLVGIGVTPPAAVLARGTSQQLTATGIYSDGTTLDITTAVAWAASNDRAISISNLAGSQGWSAALAPGSSAITATLSGKTGTATLVVTDQPLVAIAVAGGSGAIAKGTTQQFVATGLYADGSAQDLSADVTWAASDSAVLFISNASGSRGLGAGAAKGTVMVTATFDTVRGGIPFAVSDATLGSLTITPGSAALASGTTAQLTAIGLYSDGTRQDLTSQVCWTASDKTVAQISNVSGRRGVLTAVGKGSAELSASLFGVMGSGAVTVTDATLVALAISPRAMTLALGAEQQFVAMGTFSDGSSQDLTGAATWSSSVPAVAAISNAADSKGVATSVSIGPTIIVASVGGKTDSTTLTVN